MFLEAPKPSDEEKAPEEWIPRLWIVLESGLTPAQKSTLVVDARQLSALYQQEVNQI